MADLITERRSRAASPGTLSPASTARIMVATSSQIALPRLSRPGAVTRSPASRRARLTREPHRHGVEACSTALVVQVELRAAGITCMAPGRLQDAQAGLYPIVGSQALRDEGWQGEYRSDQAAR